MREIATTTVNAVQPILTPIRTPFLSQPGMMSHSAANKKMCAADEVCPDGKDV